jgi:hypothetical protein
VNEYMRNNPETPFNSPIRVNVVWTNTHARRGKVAPSAYAYAIPEFFGDHVFWGRGGEAMSQALLIDVAIRLVRLKYTRVGLDRPFEICRDKGGTGNLLDNSVYTWVDDVWRRKTAEFSPWMKREFAKQVQQMQFVRRTRKEAKHFSALRAFALEKAREAQSLKEHHKLGVAWTDTNLKLPQIVEPASKAA